MTDTTASPAATEMAPCPFCGADAEFLQGKRCLTIRCENLCAEMVSCADGQHDMTEHFLLQNLLKIWNTRATPDLAALRSAGYAVVKADMQRDARRMAMALLSWTPDLNVQTEAEARETEEEILAIARRFALTKDPTNAQ